MVVLMTLQRLMIVTSIARWMSMRRFSFAIASSLCSIVSVSDEHVA